jgi:WD40 repeat protein
MSIDKVVTLAAPQGAGTGFGSAWSPNGDRIAVAGLMNSVLAWGIASHELILQVQHADTVPCVAWSPDGRMIASGTSAGGVHLIDPAIGREVRAAQGHSDEVRSVSFSPDGRRLASGANDGVVRVWSATELAPISTINAHNGLVRSVAWSPNGSMLASGGHDNTVRVWSTDSWQGAGGLADHTGWVAKVAFSPDGRFLASGSGDSTVRIWDLAGQKYHRVLDQFDSWWVVDFVFSPDSRFIAAINNDPAIYVYDIHSGTLVAQVTVPYGSVAITWSPDGRYLATSGFETIIWITPASPSE